MSQEATLPPAAAAFLAQARVAHLATADAAGRPHVIPIVFVLLDGRLYSPLDTKPKRVAPRQLKRVRNLCENPQVAVVVDRYTEDWSRLAYVLLTGTARLVEDGEEAQRARAALRAKYPQYVSGAFALADTLLVAIEPARVVCWGPLTD
jgi:coenzyme F420-0:L-glutamate ligase/coenzyme F420-1:gamma-L-glutamate ligase